jgi:hypothetical protein
MSRANELSGAAVEIGQVSEDAGTTRRGERGDEGVLVGAVLRYVDRLEVSNGGLQSSLRNSVTRFHESSFVSIHRVR